MTPLLSASPPSSSSPAPSSPSRPPVPIPPALRRHAVAGLGLSCVDTVAPVARYPPADAKVRTGPLTLMSGGNCANALVAVRRLGLPVLFCTQTGTDPAGQFIRADLHADGIDTAPSVVRTDGTPSASVFVVVDSASNTRTCFATVPSSDLDPCHVDVDVLLQDPVNLLVLDGRHTLAAIHTACAARHRDIPVLLDVERKRPHIERLMQMADYLVTNQQFPKLFAPTADSHVDAMCHMLAAHGRARFVVTTLGERGAVLVRRIAHGGGEDEDDIVDDSHRDIHVERRVLISKDGHGHDKETTAFNVQVVSITAWHIDSDDIVDTVGAGDAFIGGLAYGIATGMPLTRMLRLATFVAASNLRGTGRSRVPRREEVADALLN